ncbi:hypothetical protein ADUPG1_004985, partial [Aduncisulcus paluster]
MSDDVYSHVNIAHMLDDINVVGSSIETASSESVMFDAKSFSLDFFSTSCNSLPIVLPACDGWGTISLSLVQVPFPTIPIVTVEKNEFIRHMAVDDFLTVSKPGYSFRMMQPRYVPHIRSLSIFTAPWETHTETRPAKMAVKTPKEKEEEEEEEEEVKGSDRSVDIPKKEEHASVSSIALSSLPPSPPSPTVETFYEQESSFLRDERIQWKERMDSVL